MPSFLLRKNLFCFTFWMLLAPCDFFTSWVLSFSNIFSFHLSLPIEIQKFDGQRIFFSETSRLLLVEELLHHRPGPSEWQSWFDDKKNTGCTKKSCWQNIQGCIGRQNCLANFNHLCSFCCFCPFGLFWPFWPFWLFWPFNLFGSFGLLILLAFLAFLFCFVCFFCLFGLFGPFDFFLYCWLFCFLFLISLAPF